MAGVGNTASHSVSESELEQIGHFAVTLSGRLARIHHNDLASSIAEALQEIAVATGADGCQLIEFTPSGSVAKTHTPIGCASANGEPPAARLQEHWLVERLARGESVVVSRLEDLPRDATGAREQAHRSGFCCVLGVPAFAGGQVTCALVLDNNRVRRQWQQALVERIQLLSEIFATGLQHDRSERALLASLTVIEQLNARLEAENLYLKEEIKTQHDFDDIVGESAPLRLALARVSQVAPTNSNVLLLGPTGSGKELFARAVHERSQRRDRPLVRVNCAALPPTLVESELFGHEKGAFTGAINARQGRFELADGGTIFLDEIGDLALDVQVKFLRVLQEGEFERVGSSRTKRVNVRVIAATHQALDVAVAEGRFRSDLYYRLCVYPICLPSLSERVDDIPRLVWFFIHRHQRELGRPISKVPQSVMDALQQYSWPGNIRELENVVERAMISSTGDTLRLDESLRFGGTVVARAAAASASENLDGVQRSHIESVLERCGWRINGSGNAAERLGIHPNTLRFRMKKLGVSCPEGRARQPRPAGAGAPA
jgi:formate hydrogenlyase transcriptional activator